MQGRELTDADAGGAFHGKHDLRAMYTRDNTERRRVSGHTLRRYLTTAQDKLFIARALKIRQEYQIASNSDAVIVLAKGLIAEGKEAELAPDLVKIAKATDIPRRARAWDDALDH
ncbi:MAG: hypothetical protein ACYDBQ_01900 [Thermoplasmatota archaeon]